MRIFRAIIFLEPARLMALQSTKVAERGSVRSEAIRHDRVGNEALSLEQFL